MKSVAPSSEILAHITIKLADASVADSTKVNRAPSLIRLNAGDVSAAFVSALLGHRMGETVSFTLEPVDAFGYSNPGNIHRLPRARFTDSDNLKIGDILEFSQMNGTNLPGIIRALDETEVTVDFNHPLCGQTLTFEVEILAIDPPADYQAI